MCQRRYTLHLNRVHVLQRMVQDSRCINDLPSQVLVIQVSNKEGLCGERVWLDINVRSSDLVNEGGLSDVGVAADEEGTGVGINGGETGDVLAHLL